MPKSMSYREEIYELQERKLLLSFVNKLMQKII